MRTRDRYNRTWCRAKRVRIASWSPPEIRVINTSSDEVLPADACRGHTAAVPVWAKIMAIPSSHPKGECAIWLKVPATASKSGEATYHAAERCRDKLFATELLKTAQ